MANNYGPNFNAKLLFIEPEVTILRHSDTCRGVIKNGQCSSCNEQTIGEPNCYFSLMLCDLEDSKDMYNLIGYKAAGEAIFGKGKTATQVQDMNDEAVADILEEWSEVPININAVVEYDFAKGKTRISPHNLMRMPLDYLTESPPSTTDGRIRGSRWLFTLDPWISLAVYFGSMDPVGCVFFVFSILRFPSYGSIRNMHFKRCNSLGELIGPVAPPWASVLCRLGV